MTREEAKAWLNKLYARADITDEYGDMEDMQPYEEALRMAIKALEQEPSGDAISRQAALEQTYLWSKDEFLRVTNPFDYLRKRINSLPPVNPQPKTGHWIEDAKTYYEELNKRGLGVDEYTPYFTDDIACSECLAKYSMLDNETQFFKYCPNCGAKMEGDTE